MLDGRVVDVVSGPVGIGAGLVDVVGALVDDGAGAVLGVDTGEVEFVVDEVVVVELVV